MKRWHFGHSAVIGAILVPASGPVTAWVGATSRTFATGDAAVAAIREAHSNSKLAPEAALSTPPRTPEPGQGRNS